MGKGSFSFSFFFASTGYDLRMYGPDCHNIDVLFSFGLYAISGKILYIYIYIYFAERLYYIVAMNRLLILQ